MEKRVTQDRFSALLDAAVDGVFVINSSGEIEVANQAVERLLGYEQQEMLGRNIKYFMPSPYRENHDQYLADHMRTEETKIIGIGREVEAQHKDGMIIQIYLSVGRYDDGEEVKFVGIMRDLSELKKSEAELQSAESEIHELVNRLAQVSRIGVMGEMAASIAHEINQPLTAISTYAQAATRLMQNDPSQAEQVEKTLEKINAQALRAGDIIKGLRSWIRDQDTERKSCDCNQLITEVVDIARMEAHNSDVLLKMELDTTELMVMCDPVQIQQVILNLIKNSIDAVDEFFTNKIDERRVVTIQSKRLEKERIEVSVSDLGPGIPADKSEELFTPFFTTKENEMGMGLSICQTIIRSHGGELAYENNPDAGVRFCFSLPTAV
ncbi:MAG: PAS domain S-box protein [Pseudomonadales bacterium]|nr:PAS domain S-box protein [Pseudomonadales bacterium]